LYYYLNKRLPI